MSWRDFIVTSRHTQTEFNPLTKGDSVDIVDIVPNKSFSSSSFTTETISQILTPSKASTEYTKPPELIPDAIPVTNDPISPLRQGWLVAYRDQMGHLRGGCDERAAGTVKHCRWTGTAWTVTMINGASVPLMTIVSVGKTDVSGSVIAAWNIRDHGYDGERGAMP